MSMECDMFYVHLDKRLYRVLSEVNGSYVYSTCYFKKIEIFHKIVKFVSKAKKSVPFS